MKSKLKKSLSLLLALVMAMSCMSLGAFAAGDGTGYNGATLPTGPENMTAEVIDVTAENAQYVLDGAYGNIDGKTINFIENINTVLELALPTKYADSGTTGNYPDYYRTVSNVTFTANNGVTLAGFYFAPGHAANDNAYEKYDYVLDRVVTSNNDGHYRHTTLSGITFQGLTIEGSVEMWAQDEYGTISAITFKNCVITNNNGKAINLNSQSPEKNAYGAVTVQNCTITAGNEHGVYVNGAGGLVSVTNSYVTAKSNAIQIVASTKTDAKAQVNITGNYLKSNKYTVNLSGVSNITFSGNVVVAGSRGHLGHYKGDASGNFWAEQDCEPNASGNMTTLRTAPIEDTEAGQGENDITCTSYYTTYTATNPAPSVGASFTLDNLEYVGGENYVAQIGSNKYETLEAAFAAAQDGETITLLADVALSAPLNVEIEDKAITLDLNNKTLTGRTNLKSGELTIQNGTVAGGAQQALNVYGSSNTSATNYSVLNIENNVNVTANEFGVCLFGKTATTNGYGAVINIAGTIHTAGSGSEGAVFVSGNLGNNISEGYNNNVINITGEITSDTDTALALNGLAQVNIENDARLTGDTAVTIKRGFLNVNGGTLTSTGEKNYPGSPNYSGSEMTGAGISMTDTYNNYGPMAVNVTGGTITSTYADAIYKKAATYDNAATITVSGGTFSSDPTDYVAAGYEAKDNGDSTWTVQPATTISATQKNNATDAGTSQPLAVVVTEANVAASTPKTATITPVEIGEGVTDGNKGKVTEITQEALSTYAQANSVEKVEIITGLSATAAVGADAAPQTKIVDENGTTIFEAKAKGGQLRFDKKMANSTDIVGDFERTKDKASAIDFFDLRLQFEIKLPDGVKVADADWSWTLKYGTKTMTVQGKNYLPVGNNSYTSNVVVTNVPLSQLNTDFKATLTITYVLDGVTYTITQSDSTPLARQLQDLVSSYQSAEVYDTLDSETKAYIDSLAQYVTTSLQKHTPVL